MNFHSRECITLTPRAISRAIALALGVALASSACAQGYTTAFGLRVGRAGGVTLVQRVGKRVSVEAYAVNRLGTDAVTVTALVRRHIPLPVRKLNLFVGAGPHKGWNYEDEESRRGNPFGVAVQAGLELTLGRTSFAFDYIPQIHLSGRVVPVSLQSAVSVRYVVAKRRGWVERKLREDRGTIRERRRRKRERARGRKARARPSLWERLGLD